MLTHSSLVFYRAIGLCIFLAAIAEKILLGTLFLSYLLTLLSLSAVMANKTSVLSMLPKAFLTIIFYYEVMLLLGIQTNLFKSEMSGNLIVITPMIICGLAAFFRISQSSGSRDYSLGLFAGSTVFLSFVAFAYMKFEGVLTWAMSGDSRNHIYQMRAVIDRGGIIHFNGYPALANGFAALMGGWRYDSGSVSTGHLGTEIHILGFASATTLVTCSVLAGLFLKKEAGKNVAYIAVAAAVISLIPFSQVFLNTYFTEGFFPSSLSLAVVLAVVFELTRSNSGFTSRILFSVMGSLLILLTFPLLLPLLLPGFFIAFLLRFYSNIDSNCWPTQYKIKKKASVLIFLSIPVLTVELVSRIPSANTYLFRNLNVYGRISPIDDWGLWILTITAGLLFLIASHSTKLISSITFIIGVLSIHFSVVLNRILDASYYLHKFVWMTTNIMILLNLIIAANLLLSVTSSLKKLAIGFMSLGIVALTSFPLIQDFPFKPNLLTLATSPKYPSAQDAHLITTINRIAPRSIFWQISPDFETTQVIDIWITLGFDFDHGAFTWGYNSDVFSLTAVCSFAEANQPATIWVVTPEVQSLVKSMCTTKGLTIRVIPS